MKQDSVSDFEKVFFATCLCVRTAYHICTLCFLLLSSFVFHRKICFSQVIQYFPKTHKKCINTIMRSDMRSRRTERIFKKRQRKRKQQFFLLDFLGTTSKTASHYTYSSHTHSYSPSSPTNKQTKKCNPGVIWRNEKNNLVFNKENEYKSTAHYTYRNAFFRFLSFLSLASFFLSFLFSRLCYNKAGSPARNGKLTGTGYCVEAPCTL